MHNIKRLCLVLLYKERDGFRLAYSKDFMMRIRDRKKMGMKDHKRWRVRRTIVGIISIIAMGVMLFLVIPVIMAYFR